MSSLISNTKRIVNPIQTFFDCVFGHDDRVRHPSSLVSLSVASMSSLRSPLNKAKVARICLSNTVVLL